MTAGPRGPMLQTMTTENEGEAILSDWAEVERTLNKAKSQFETVSRSSDEAIALRAEIDRLIDEWASLWHRYRVLRERAEEDHQVALPEWPEAAS